MAIITVSPLLEENNPPTGIIETDESVTVVLALDDINLFIAMEPVMRPMLVETLGLALVALQEPAPVT